MMATGNGIVTSPTVWIDSSKEISLEEYERIVHRVIEKEYHRDEYREPFVGSGIRGRCHDWTIRDVKVGNRQRMTPVEYRMVGEPFHDFNSVRMVGDVIIGGERVGHWSTTIERQYLDTVKENLCSGKEQEMGKSLFEVYVVNKGKFVDVWTGIASTGENARFKAISELGIDTDIENLDTFTRVVGNLRDDCCK